MAFSGTFRPASGLLVPAPARTYGGAQALPRPVKAFSDDQGLPAPWLGAADLLPACLALLAPWGLFAGVLALESFELRHSYEALAHALSVLLLLAALASGLCLLSRRPGRRVFGGLLLATSLLAFAVGMAAGARNYEVNLKPAYGIMTLNTYADVDPSKTNGSAILDAGRVLFTQDSRIDFMRSARFVKEGAYCVAPIVSQSAPAVSYEFWAVGVDCCGAAAASFACGEYSNAQAHGGLRLLRDDQRPYFRMAVQQAEAQYGITARHPLFFHFLQDPAAEVAGLRDRGWHAYSAWIAGAMVFQLFAVAAAAVVLPKVSTEANRYYAV